jgi:ParB/RepB/Spo0J family partition protein
VLQPILVRPIGQNRYQLVAGERRWRASKQAGLETIPALIEEIDDDTALEISIIENLQREDISPLDEAAMYDRMVREHGYSIRKLADKLGKDKGYLENRLRLADAPPEIRELVSLRKDTLSHAYELMKVDDPKKRRRLADQVARGELTLIKLRDKIEGRRSRPVRVIDDIETAGNGFDVSNGVGHDEDDLEIEDAAVAEPAPRPAVELTDDSLVNAKQDLGEALDALVDVLRSPDAVASITEIDRANLAKYLTIAKLRLENAIAIVRTGDTRD